MRDTNGFYQWQFVWGTPRNLIAGPEDRKLEIAFLVAILLHTTPFTFLWHKQATKKPLDTVTLENVEFIEPEIEQPVVPPAPEVKKPKNTLDFLKMALPIFKKREVVPEIPREIEPVLKVEEPKLAEPERLLMEKKMAPLKSDIKLDISKSAPAPKIVEIAKLPSSQRALEPRTVEPPLKLEEVGRRAVVPPPQTPGISMEKSRKVEKLVDLPSIQRSRLAPQTSQLTEKLVEKAAPAIIKPPSLADTSPLGYKKRGSKSISLDEAREIVQSIPKPQIETSIPKSQVKERPEVIQISKEKVKITGQLSGRKVVKSYVPEYPDWAKEKNIEADVAIRFTVTSNGDVREQMTIQRTSGYLPLDKLALEALKRWKFSPLVNSDQDEWGVITFRFLLE